MSDVSQGPGWWLASDGKWYPPHTAPQATLPPDASAHATYTTAPSEATRDPYAGAVTQQPTADPYAGAAQQPAAEPYAGQQPAAEPYAGQPAAYAPAGYQGQPYHPGFPATGYPYQAPGTAEPQPAPGPTATAPVPAPAARGGARWQPWLALAGIALIIWGAGQGLLAWSEWHVVEQQFGPYGTVSQGHIAMALVAAGTLIAGIAVVAMALVMDRR